MVHLPPQLWALHIADGVLSAPWLVGGFLLAGLFGLIGAYRIREEEVASVALLTAGFFVITLIHLRIGPTSAHLLLGGLLGVLLGVRVALAIPVGLALQAILIGHGGYTTLGINTCVLVLPALIVGGLFRGLRRWRGWVRVRGGLVALSALLWLFSLVMAVSLVLTNPLKSIRSLELGPALGLTFHPLTLTIVVTLTALLVWMERRWNTVPEHVLGLLLGELAVLLSALLNCAVLLWGGVAQWDAVALTVLLAHLPLALLEGVVLAFTVGFLLRVKPELLGIEPTPPPIEEPVTEEAPLPAGSERCRETTSA